MRSPGGNAQGSEQVGLARATVAKQDHRFGTGDVPALRQRCQSRGGDRWRLAEVKLLQRLHTREVRVLDTSLNGATFAVLQLSAQERFEIAQVRLALPLGLRGEAPTLAGNGGQMQRLALLRHDRLPQDALCRRWRYGNSHGSHVSGRHWRVPVADSSNGVGATAARGTTSARGVRSWL